MTEIQNNKLIKTTEMYEEAARRYDELFKIMKDREQALIGAPEGKTHIVKAGKRVQFYLRKNKSDKSGVYISKKETGKIIKYTQKAYDEKVVKALNSELHNLEFLLCKSDNIIERIRKMYSDNPAEIKRMINPIDISDEDYKTQWQQVEYVGKPVAEYLPYYETKRKERVRSKSELAIANMLDQYGVPYKYECPITLKIGSRTVYPDFTVLNVRKRKALYWEHRGMMDDKDYARQAVYKAKQYRKNGIIPGDNLIITEETSTDPLGTDEIESVIKRHLL
ncbi:MAG: hypothetical protein K6E49_07715 [Lachnospiraceae bacterium]|nr:hypothetical protein [Lachnospiraceae bacterium]